jgi:hypothetical protein
LTTGQDDKELGAACEACAPVTNPPDTHTKPAITKPILASTVFVFDLDKN